ncbi:MAG: hypothetical protein ACE10F_10205, partial [Candidatus Methylomirabilales bacterium]
MIPAETERAVPPAVRPHSSPHHMVKFVTFGETMAQYNASYTGPFDEGGDYVLDCAGAESNVALDLQRLEVPGVEA